MVFTDDIEMLEKLFPEKRYIGMTSEEAEMTKYVHNIFGALKATYFNCIYSLCQNKSLDYQKILEGILSFTYINVTHTYVPGPDGKSRFSGKCFPKDIIVFRNKFKDTCLGKLIEPLMSLNKQLRHEEVLQ